jgi:hypothetical protein
LTKEVEYAIVMQKITHNVFCEAIMKRLSILLLGFMVICIGDDIRAADLRGKFAISGMGGMCYSIGGGFSSKDGIKNNYGFGVSVEYFFLKPISGGFALVHNSFQGDWHRSMNPEDRCHYSSDWNWTNLSIFGKFVMGPENEISPYFKGGLGLYIPKMKDWAHYPPDTTYTHESYGKGQFGWYLGFGVHCLLTKKVLVYVDVPLNFIYTKGLVIRGVDVPVQIGPSQQIITQYHEIRERSQYFNIFAGVSFLLGTGK